MSIPLLGWEEAPQHSPASSSSGNFPPATSDSPAGLSAAITNSAIGTHLPARGFLHIARHGAGGAAVYVVSYRCMDVDSQQSKPVVAEGPRLLLDLLERLGVDLGRGEVRGALNDVLRFGSANIPDHWFAGERLAAELFHAE